MRLLQRKVVGIGLGGQNSAVPATLTNSYFGATEIQKQVPIYAWYLLTSTYLQIPHAGRRSCCERGEKATITFPEGICRQ
jgi:hypothetical protein